MRHPTPPPPAPAALYWLALAALPAALGWALPARAENEAASCPQLNFRMEAPEISLPDEVVLNADQVSLEQEGLSKLIGAVRIRQGDKLFNADAVEFEEKQRRVLVNAESLFSNKDFVIRSQKTDFDLAREAGIFTDAEFTLPARSARGTSETMSLSRDGEADLKGVTYTTCAPGSRGWQLKAGSISLDREEGMGTATNMRLHFLGAPIFYAPYFRFPIDDRRRTGLLFPTIGDSDRTGFDVQVPVYLNLAPNYDATITPRSMSERGMQLNTDFRYLLEKSEGKARYEFLDEDKQTGEKRDYAKYEHHGLINRRTALEVLYANTSDPTYFEDFGGRLDLSSITHLERTARLTYQAPASYRIQAMVQDYQTLASAITSQTDEPYRRLPQILVDAETRKSFLDTRLGFNGEYVNFARTDSVEGQRVNLRPYLRAEREGSAWFARGELDYALTQYKLTGTAPGQDNEPERALPSFSAEYGLRFERITDGGQLQLLEPRLFYLYVPFDDQDDLPNFDSGEPDFEFTQLFSRNRFLGEDRISDANHMAFATSLRQLDPNTGVTRFTASVGQLFRFEAPRVQLPNGEAPPDSGVTDFIAGLDYRFSEKLRGVTALQWSPDDNEFNRTSFGISYRDNRRRLDLAYRYREDTLEQSDVIFYSPIFSNWAAAARWRYSLREEQTLDTQAGLEYETCCWTLRTSYRRYIATTSGEYSTGIYIQLELKGLTRIGTGFAGLLPADSEYY